MKEDDDPTIFRIYTDISAEMYSNLPTANDVKKLTIYFCEEIKFKIVHLVKNLIYVRRTLLFTLPQ